MATHKLIMSSLGNSLLTNQPIYSDFPVSPVSTSNERRKGKFESLRGFFKLVIRMLEQDRYKFEGCARIDQLARHWLIIPALRRHRVVAIN